MVLKIKLLKNGENAKAFIPSKMTEGAAGYDISSAADEPITVEPGKLVKIPCGFAMEIEKGYAGFIFGRSGLGIKHGIHPSNAVGVIDSDYRGEVCVGLCNVGDEPYTVMPGDRIAQLVIMPVTDAELSVTEILTESERGEGGFGSTGRK